MLVKFGEVNTLILITAYSERIEDINYLDRITNLVHDLPQEFKFETRKVEDSDSSEWVEIVKDISGSSPF